MVNRLSFWAAIAGPLALAWLAAAGVTARGDAASRYRRALVAAQPVRIGAAEGVAIMATDRAGGQRRLESLIADRASRAGLRLAIIAHPSTNDGMIAAQLGGTGGERAVRTFAASLERGRPTVRLTRWSVRSQGDVLRFDADATAIRLPPGAMAGGGDVTIAAPLDGKARDPGGLFAIGGTAEGAQPSGGPPQVVGIVGRLAIDARAIVRLGDGSTRTLAPGQAAGAWRLIAIGADRVRFGRAGMERTMVLPTAIETAPSDQ